MALFIFVYDFVDVDENSNEKMRQDCVNELIQTEKAYIEDMSIVHKVFEVPLMESRVVSKQDVEKIFVNWSKLVETNQAFLKDLLQRTSNGSDIIGDIICKHVRFKTFIVIFTIKKQ